jgi:hypothetical protein
MLALGAGPVAAPNATAAPAAGWTLSSLAQPTVFAHADNVGCESGKACDEYAVTATNVGGVASSGPLEIVAKLPAQLNAAAIGGELNYMMRTFAARSISSSEGECQLAGGGREVRCSYSGEVPPSGGIRILLAVTVAGKEPGTASNRVELLEGATLLASTEASNQVNAPAAPFAVQSFEMGAFGQDGLPDAQAGGRPGIVSSTFSLSSTLNAPGGDLEEAVLPTREVKSVIVELPLGLVGDPAAAQQCPEVDLVKKEGGTCPPDSRVGAYEFDTDGELVTSQEEDPTKFGYIYNMEPVDGFPAVFGFKFITAGVLMFASVVHTPAGYRLRVSVPDLPRSQFPIVANTITFFGDPEALDGKEGVTAAFFRNPTSCGSDPFSARIEADSWAQPEDWQSREAMVYPGGIEGCSLLKGESAFTPTLTVKPTTSAVDSPSGYDVQLHLDQAPDVMETPGSPDLKEAVVTLPTGVAISPSGANGLVACQAEGPRGINIGSDQIGAAGQDLGDPEATELGAGHPGGDQSPYDDGIYHIAPGHCPDSPTESSVIGSVTAKSPLLGEELAGNLYVAEPHCSPCSEAQVEEGDAFGLYMELSGKPVQEGGEGVIVKLPGSVEVGGYGPHSTASDLAPGQVRARFAESPQMPVEEVEVEMSGGATAALASPQTCGTFAATGQFTSWSQPESPVDFAAQSFQVEGCPAAGAAFAPAFTAGGTSQSAGAYSGIVVNLSRGDGEQDLAGLSVTMPPGVAGLIADVPLCGEPQASAGSCPEASRIGTAHVAAGAGPEPLWLEGPVYLTGPYGGAPFGLSVVVPAVAGPYNLGEVVVRARISVDPHTAQVAVTSDPLPQSHDGVPIRLKRLHIEVDRPSFMFNPTSCAQMQITGSISGDLPDGSAGSSIPVSTPFAVSGCKNLPFEPTFKAETHAHHSRKGGAYLAVKVTSGQGQANIAKVHVALPIALPSRLATLKQACTEQQFAADPGGCPEGAFVGTATAVTPVFSKALTGPAIFVSHGGRGFPDLDIVLQGEGVTIELTGNTFINKGITTSTFNAVPDVPVSRFQLTLPEGPHSALSGTGNFCTKTVTKQERVKLRRKGRLVHRKGTVLYETKKVKRKVRKTMLMPTMITGQNGAVVQQKTKIAVSGCATQKHGAKARTGLAGSIIHNDKEG